MSILSQPNKISQAVISNGLVTGNQVQNPQNLLNTTDDTAIFGPTSDVIIGNFPFSLPLNAVIVGVSGILKARIDNNSVPPGSLTPVLVDSSTGVNQYFPGTPVVGLSAVLQEYTIGGQYDIWGNISWTPAKINNLKLQLIGNSSLEVAWASLTVFYYIPQTSIIPPPFALPGCADCDSTIQALPFELAQPWQASGPNVTKLILKSFNLPDGTPIDMGMLGACGGTINLTVDPELRKEDGGDFIENFNLLDGLASITFLTNGTVELDIGNINQRGLDFVTPYGHNPNNISEHAVGAVVIITNNGPWNGKLLKRCHIGTLVSAPIEVQDEGDTVAVAVDKFNFIGDTVQAEQDPGDPRKANITVVSVPTNIKPTKENTTTGTTGTTPALTLTIPLTVTSANYLRVGVITENETITDVKWNGFAMTLIGFKVNPGVNLKVALFGLINPAVGTHNVVITMPTPRIITGIVVGWKDVDTTSPVDGVSAGNIGSNNQPTDSVTTTSDNTVVEDVVGTTNNPTTFTQFGLWSIDGAVNTGIRPGASSSRSVLAPQSVTDIYNLSLSTGWAIMLAGIRGISNPAATGQAKIQFQDEGSNLGTSGTVDTVDFVGPNVVATRVGNKVTVTVTGGGGTGGGYTVDQTPDNGSYGLLTGAVDGANALYTVSAGVYLTGTLVVFLNGLAQLQGASDDFQETTPGSGTFTFNTPPATGDIITAVYQINGGASKKKVGVGEIDDITFFNWQALVADKTGGTSDWSLTAATGFTNFIGMGTASDVILSNIGPSMATSTLGQPIQFDAAKQIVIQGQIAYTASPTGKSGWGFGTLRIAQGTNTLGIGFVSDAAGNFFTYVSDGVAHTENAMTSIADGIVHTIRIEYDPANIAARFYVDGILIDTITTNLPTADTTVMSFSSGEQNFGELIMISAPSFAIEI